MNRFLSLNERVLLLIRQENEASKRLFLYDAQATVMTSVDDSRTPTDTPERPGPCDTPEAARLLGERRAREWGVTFAMLKRLYLLAYGNASC